MFKFVNSYSLLQNNNNFQRRLKFNQLPLQSTIEFVSLTSEYLEGALKVVRKAIYPDELACLAVGIPKCEGSMGELDEFLKRTAKDGVSIVAIEKKSKKVIGTAFNKIQVNGSAEEAAYFKNFASSCKYNASKIILDLMTYIDAQCNLFEQCQTNCLMELTFLGTLQEFRRKGVAEKICEVSTEVATSLFKGLNVKVPLDGDEELSLEPKPKVIVASFSSPYSKKIGRSLNWNLAATVDMQKFLVNGEPFADMPDCTLEYKKLE